MPVMSPSPLPPPSRSLASRWPSLRRQGRQPQRRFSPGSTKAADLGAELVVFRVRSDGYSFESRAEASSTPSRSPVTAQWQSPRLCPSRRPMDLRPARIDRRPALNGVCPGRPRRDRVVPQDHLPFLGVDRFADPGDRPFAVLEVEGLRIGMHICYDGAFPEACRVLTLLGADVLVLPTNWRPV